MTFKLRSTTHCSQQAHSQFPGPGNIGRMEWIDGEDVVANINAWTPIEADSASVWLDSIVPRLFLR